MSRSSALNIASVTTASQLKIANAPSDYSTTYEMQSQNIKDLANLFAGKMAETYNQRTGGANVRLATHLISLVTPHLPDHSRPLRILDNACGPLVLTTELLKTESITAHSKVHISAVDISADFISSNSAAIVANPTFNTDKILIDTAVMNGMDLQYPESVFDASFTSLAIFAFPDPIKGAREIYRTLKPGGVAALTTWKHLGWTGWLNELEKRIRSPGSEPTRFPMLDEWKVPGKLEKCLRDAGFADVQEGHVKVTGWFDNVEEMVRCLTETLKPMVGSGWTEGEKERMNDGFLELLREKVRDGTAEADGYIFEGEHGEGRVGAVMVAFTAVAKK